MPEVEAERIREGFHVPDEFRAFMRKVVVKIDWSDEGGSLMGADALQDECGHGGRIEPELYRFVYIGKDGGERWTITLREQQIRDIANGDLTEIDADREAVVVKGAKGDPLLVWGEFREDALAVRTQRELAVALEALHAAAEAPDSPQSLRLWSNKDDQLFAVIYGDQCAIYVIESEQGYGTSAGDPTRTESFDIVDQDIGALTVPWSDCVPWDAARAGLMRFAESGELGPDITLDGRIPVSLLSLGDFTREAELETRPAPLMDPGRTSLMRINPFATWGRRLIDALRGMELIELLDTNLDRVLVELAPLLHAHAEKAQVSPRSADRIANELGAIRGVDRMFATGADIQTVLRRTKDPTE